MMAPLAAVLGALVHRGAHAAALLALGGDIVGAATGVVGDEQPATVAMAPTLAWAVLLTGIVGYTALSRPGGFVARVLVLYGVGLALVDASWGAAGLFLGFPTSDWFGPLHEHAGLVVVAWGAYVAAVGEVGWRLVERAFAGRVSPALYTGGVLATLVIPWLTLLAAVLLV